MNTRFAFAFAVALASALAACSSDSTSDTSASSGGASGSSDTAGSGGSSDTAGSGGSSGAGDAAGSGGVAGSGTTDRPTSIAALTGDVTSGQALFTTNCVSCHGSDAKSGTAHENTPQTAASETAFAIQLILSGKESMPSFSSTLSDQQIADILAYLKSLN
jgi:mono/diheme cytochrome c family protein